MNTKQQPHWSRLDVGTLFLILCIALTFLLFPIHSRFPIVPSTTAHPLIRFVKEGENPLTKLNGARFACQSATAPARCYSPQEIRTAYSITPLLQLGFTGAGHTIVIIDAYQSPTIKQDLEFFDRIFGLPNPTLTILAPDGLTPFNPLDPGQVTWASEITLDVEWAHAIAPGAKITLVLAKDSDDTNLLSATRFAINTNQGDIITQSYGAGEPCYTSSLAALHQTFRQATTKNITLLAASGDTGAAQISQTSSSIHCGGDLPYFLSVAAPANDPLVTSVGGTHLNLDLDTGQYISETTWNDIYGASGGGYSTVFPRPSYQDAFVKDKQRGVPDVAFDADPNGGVLVIFSSYAPNALPATFIFGGTSAGSPQWAGIIALANQFAGKRLGFINAALSRIAQSRFYRRAFHDIVEGNNTFTRSLANGQTITIQGYNATPGWDATTGLGSPNVSALVPLLIANKHIGDGKNL